jgi:DNA repair exonuclease SbcCD nuclease subunit
MKFAFTADVHLSSYSQDSIEEKTNLPERLDSIKNALHEMARYCLDNDVNTIVIGGDLLHGKSIIYAIAQDIMLQYFRAYKDKLTFIVLDGNHDLSGKGERVVSALTSLDNEPNVQRVAFDAPQIIGNIAFVPYSSRVAEYIKNFDKNRGESNVNVLISHFGLNEGVLNSGLSIVTDISVRDLRKHFDLVLLGHYHKPQQIVTDDISVYYVGSPIQLDWGERDDEKRFLIVDSDTLEVKSVPTAGYRKHIQLQLTNENKAQIVQEAKKAQDAGHYVKLIKTDKIDTSDIKDSFTVIDKSEKDITNRGISSSMSDDVIMTKYMEMQEIPEEQRKDYLDEARGIINEGN